MEALAIIFKSATRCCGAEPVRGADGAAGVARGFEQNVKNIARPVRIYALRAEAVVTGLKRQIVEI